MTSKKLCVIGLDCADPELVFNRWRHELPHMERLRSRGIWARMRSTDPPITIPAWISMVTGKDPGELGIYGFRNRKDYSYRPMSVASSRDVMQPRIWDWLKEYNKNVILIGIPLTYPPEQVNGLMVSGLLTPSPDSRFTWPDSLRAEVLELCPDYLPDVPDYRNVDEEDFVRQIRNMTAARFRLIRHWIMTKPWDFLMAVEIGLDRMQHRFWPDNGDSRASGILLDYYRYLDTQIGGLTELLDEDTTVMILSDHGARKSLGGFCINDWLIDRGYQVLQEPPAEPVPLDYQRIDWQKTVAWAEGGYYARININLAGREPAGIVPQSGYKNLITGLTADLQQIRSDSGEHIPVKVLRPEDIYRQVHGIAPDLMVYIDDLNYRSVATVGHRRHFIQNDISGIDAANHDFHGLFICSGDAVQCREIGNMDIYDIAPTILGYFGIEAPPDLYGRNILT